MSRVYRESLFFHVQPVSPYIEYIEANIFSIDFYTSNIKNIDDILLIYFLIGIQCYVVFVLPLVGIECLIFIKIIIMNDSQQINNYLQIVDSLLASRKEWNEVPEIVSLTFKAISHLLIDYKESFQEHKTLINQQSLKIKEQELRLGSKMGKKQMQNEIVNYMKSHQVVKKEEDSVSQYEKLIKQSRYSRGDKQKYDNISIQQLKTIAQIIAQKKISQFKKGLQSKTQALKDQTEHKFTFLKEQLKNKLLQHEKELRELRERVTQYRTNQNRFEESNIKLIRSISEEKIVQLENSNKVLSNNINEIINHIQHHYVSKEQMGKMAEEKGRHRNEEKMKSDKLEQRQKVKSQHKQKGVSKIEKDQHQISKIVQSHFAKIKERDYKQWYEFKQSILKEMGQMIKVETITQLLDKFQKEMLEKNHFLSNNMAKLQQKWIKNEQNRKDILVKSEKRGQKKSSPQKSIQSIQQAISRLQRAILQKQNGQSNRMSYIIQENINKYDTKLIKQLDRRQKHLCQVIEQTYNQSKHEKIGENSNEIKSSIKKLFQTNIFCRYLYHGQKECKKDSFISWQQQIQNSIVQNFVWKKDTILINSGGLYRLQLALFGDIQSETHILINDIKTAALNRPELVKNTGNKVKGSYYSELFLLPNKSKVCVKANQNFYGKAYLSIQKL